MHIARRSYIQAGLTWWRGRAWWMVVLLVVGCLWFYGHAMGQGPMLSRYRLAVLGSQRLAAAAEQRPSAARELPSDAEMIAHFQTHRAEFEELVRLYQTDERRNKVGNRQPFWTEQYTETLFRAGIRHLSEDGALWLPDPYFVETAEKARAMDVFHAYAYHGITLYVENMKFSPSVRRLVWKDYFYVPVVPKVENGQLWWPRSRHGGDLNRSAPVFASLDDYPPDWLLDPPRGRGCVYRQIEPQWFLSLCRSR